MAFDRKQNLCSFGWFLHLQSSMLMVILRELPLLEGSVYVKGRIAFVSQQPWVFSASLRQNIVFGNKFDKARYNTILTACALDKVGNI